MARIELDGAGIVFQVHKGGRPSLKDVVLQGFRRRRGSIIEVRALEDVSFRVDEGERLGVIGHNGAGKSTLLKLLAGVYRPTSGSRVVEGRVCSLFDLALGFEIDATGWENIHYRGYLQRETPRSIRAKVQAIAEFSELGDALDMPIRYYSAGMLVRLAFSIATSIEPEILLLDEVLGAGDLAFQDKAKRRMQELIHKARLMVLVSHDLTTLPRLCDRVLWLDHGRVRQVGPAQRVIDAYKDHTRALSGQAA
jgi:ABC-type polysaccharide/polyol phosphate transport system ATPase subunit